MPRRLVATALLSLLAHALLLGSAPRREPRPAPPLLRAFGPALVAANETALRPERLRQEREALIHEAREALRRGKLQLGAFLLRAGRIDAEEMRLDYDLEQASARYEERVADLREALRDDELRFAVPKVFGDLRYYGQPGGLMGQALLEGGGSCEQIASLVAAAVYDLGRSSEIALRYYGGVMEDGAAHITPIAIAEGEELDLMSGRPAVHKGVVLRPEELVEAYARAHGFGPRLAASGAGSGKEAHAEKGTSSLPARPTLIAGMPPNDDRYPGALPLFAARALQDPSEAAMMEESGEPMEPRDRARNCAYFVRLAFLRPPSLAVEPGALAKSGFGVELYRMPNPQKLEREALLLHDAERLAQDTKSDATDRLMGWACLAALGDMASIDFALAGERRLASLALGKHKLARQEGKKAIAEIPWSSEEGKRIGRRLSEEFGGRTWILLALEGGDAIVLDLAQRARSEDWGRISALAALLVYPPTEQRAYALVEGLSPSDQIEVMHEVFHAHDHMRPWASNFRFDDAAQPAQDTKKGAEFSRIYRVFRAMASRLWEGQREVDEILVALERESNEAGLSPVYRAALLEYLGRNALALHMRRSSGFAVAMVLKQAIEKNGHPSLAQIKRQIAFIETQGRLDARTLVDATHVK